MKNIKDYQIIEKIYESANSLVYRGIIKPNNQSIILKILKENYPTPSEITRYKQEYEITHSLNVNGVIKAYDLQRHENSLVMFLEDFGGKSLNLIIDNSQFNLEEFLIIAIKITKSLLDIHTANIIHKDINPSNIVYNQKTGKLKIIDFGIATQLSQGTQTVSNPSQLEGTLAYIAPEQTERMNRGVDYRSDFYSLGVTFYELLTTKLPFEMTDPMELVHCHIAQQPMPPHQVKSTKESQLMEIPQVVSDIVLKLLAKTPEERYQSAWGLKADLETCLQQLYTLGQISQFDLGSQDISNKFHISQKLYGREQEINQILETFERVSQGNSEMILISGYSGIGKSVLVNEIHQPITQQQSYFIRGKFDQFNRDIPYAAITQAFQDLVRQLLSEPEISLKTWKNKILEALESNAQLIIDIIPELEKIIEKQSTLEKLASNEAQNRFNLFFQRFISVFATKKHPLVVFLDDLQWADLPSLKLIERLITDTDSQHLLIIGAYRDHEVNATHPLILTLEQINKTQASVSQISLQPLSILQVNQLIADTLICTKENSKVLAELITDKTGGNPFFITQLLTVLYKEKLFIFNNYQLNPTNKKNKRGYWQWDIEQIKKIEITDNVVDLMVKKIEKLDNNTQNILKLAACIGNQFNLEVLSIVNRKPQTVTSKELQPALKEGLIIPLSNDYKIPLLWNQEDFSSDITGIGESFIPKIPENISYKFLHDRVQQAAYILIPEEKKKAVHLQVGRLLLQKIKEDNLEENLFDIVNQLNEGYELITNQSEKYELAKLNLKAGKKAKVSVAYEPALRYLEIGLGLLTSNSWDSNYKLTLEFHIEMLEVLSLNTKFIEVESLSETILQKSRNILDQVPVYQIKILSNYAQFQQKKAIDIALNFITKLGIYIPQKANNIEDSINQVQQSIKCLLQDKEISSLSQLAPMTDLYKLGTISILQQIYTSTIQLNFPLFILIVLNQLYLCLQYGNAPQAASVYCFYGMTLCGVMKDFNLGYEFGKLSLQLQKEINHPKLEALVMHLYYGFIWHWKKYLRNTIVDSKLLNGFQKGIDTGDHEYASYTVITYCLIQLFRGDNLETVAHDFTNYTNSIKKFRQEYPYIYIKICSRIIMNLLDGYPDNYHFVIEHNQHEEDRYLRSWKKDKNEWLLFIAYFSKTITCYFFNDHEQSYTNANNAERYVQSSGAYLPAPQHNFYSSLAIIAHYNHCTVEQQTLILEQVDKNQADMKLWASHCPKNFQHKYDLVEAEKARILGQNWQAQEFYEQAIQGAKKYEFIHEEALAYERTAEFYLALGREEIGKLYLRNAHHCYTIWGAKAKVKQLETEYPQYLLGVTNKSKSKELSTTISTTGADGEILDLTTVIKASQAISGEIKLEKLLQNLMKIVIENAGAEKGFLIVNHQGNWVIEAQGTVDAEKINILQSIPIEFVDPKNSTPILPNTIINYVIRTQEHIVLNEAIHEGQFINDPYIVATQSKSILCTPLLNQGQLQGIVYLENNLTTGAFTSERVELLNILSAQAAISIDNSRLYQNLEQRVEERTKELSQTLDVLKATQAELIFENDLLRSNEQPSTFKYQVGGSLSINSPTYVVRSADRNLYKALKQGEFCYILNARQMGKSSLIVRMMHHLQHEEFSCTAIDMTRIGSENVTPEQWYKGFAVELWRSFSLTKKVNLKTWWNERKDISPVQRLSQFIEEVILIEVGKQDDKFIENIVIFLDEIDSILGLSFPVNDFFTMIRSCYNQRTINPEYQRLTFALFGVATPADLISDRRRTPFNIGRAIQLEGFNEREAQPLLNGFTQKVNNPQVLLKEILAWTSGQPFLTQKLCHFIRNSADGIPINQEAEWIENLVQKMVIDNWEFQDEPEHLKTIRDRILEGEQEPTRLLEIYRRILQGEEVVAVDSPENRELLLSGLVVKEQGILRVRNRIYAQIFDGSWIETMLNSEHPTFYQNIMGG